MHRVPSFLVAIKTYFHPEALTGRDDVTGVRSRDRCIVVDMRVRTRRSGSNDICRKASV